MSPLNINNLDKPKAVPTVQTKYHRIAISIPVPESIPILITAGTATATGENERQWSSLIIIGERCSQVAAPSVCQSSFCCTVERG